MIRSFSISFCTVSKSFRSHLLFLPQKVSTDSLDISSINAVVHIPFHSLFFHQQAFPDEVLDLDKAVRTLDLTHNKLGNSLFHFFTFCWLFSNPFCQMIWICCGKKKKTAVLSHLCYCKTWWPCFHCSWHSNGDQQIDKPATPGKNYKILALTAFNFFFWELVL